MNFALEAVRGLKACWRLVCMDEDGLDDLDLSSDGFWNSFAAIFLVAPLYLYSSSAGARLATPPQPERHWFGSLALLALLWVLWPLIMLTVARIIDRRHHYVRYIVAYNWSSVYVIAALVPVFLLQQAGVIEAMTGALLSLCVIVWSLYYRWYVAKVALDVAPMTASFLVVGDLAMSVVASLIV
ncbi:MAG: hypothetical protein AAGA00_08435 [Pseudomonadota bacterium]